MPKKCLPHPLYQHDLIVDILKPNIAINARRKGLGAGEPLKVTAAEDQLLRSNSALVRLMGHVAKLEHAVHFLGQKGRTKTSGGAALRLLGPGGWTEYHLGYFYVLHRSTYDSAQWFTSEVLALNLPKSLAFDGKFRAKIKGTALVQIFEELRKTCTQYAGPRNNHLHRGQHVQAVPAMGTKVYDQLLVADAMLRLVRQSSPEKYNLTEHQEIMAALQEERELLVVILERKVEILCALLVRLINAMEPIIRKQIAAVG